MKNLLFLAAIAAVLTVFNGCQKEESRSLDVVVKTTLDPELAAIHFSVDEKRLVFENETEYQKLINYLAKKGNTYFPEFEKEVGFESYRLRYKNDEAKYQKIEDDLFATLINPEGVLQVGRYLFRVDFEKEKSYAYVLEDEMKGDGLKSATIMEQNTPIEFEWNENAFSILNNEQQLKSAQYCNGNDDKKYTFPPLASGYPSEFLPYYSIVIDAKLCYQSFTFYHSLIAKIKPDSFVSNFNTELRLTMNGPIQWDLNNQAPQPSFNLNLSTSCSSPTHELDYRPFAGTRKVQSYSAEITFGWQIVFGWLPPHSANTSSYITLSSSCN